MNRNKLFFSEKVKQWFFICPGCDEIHSFDETWNFNGDLESPTVSPSLLVNGHKFIKAGKQCHSFITGGKIQFLHDCDHDLKGQTIEIPVWNRVGDY